ncbi:MAG TPA: RsmE family RNA methyltransferase [Opitutaceae bacterium]|nr:RsmE family RNA methyltransferase [Opitutaceae bacterium]
MNLILFEAAETEVPLPRSDPRARHILDILRRPVGGTFDAGLVNGHRGKGALVEIGEQALTLRFTWGELPPPLDPITLVLGLPRPQTARKILQEAAALGVGTLDFFAAEKGEPDYAQSTLWSSGEWRRHLIAGAEQAFDTRLPEVTFRLPLAEVLAALPAGGTRLALDNYEASGPLSATAMTAPVVLALGPERGWSARERDLLRGRGFTLVHLGRRVLRTETAVVAAVTLAKAELGLFR